MTPFSLGSATLERFATEMTSVIQKNIVDEELKEWMIPNFSTTTDNDITVASFVMLGTLQKYFNYRMLCGCGLPSVTLLGEKSDWEKLHKKLDRLSKYGEEPAEWSKYLQKVVGHMVRTIDEPESQEIKDFWLRVCHTAGSEGSGMGVKSLSGWITAFIFWDIKGTKIRTYTDHDLETSHTWFEDTKDTIERKRLVLDGLEFPIIRRNSIPKAIVTCPVTILDLLTQTERKTTVMAGSVGVGLSEDTARVKLLSGWWVLQDSETSMSRYQFNDESLATGSTTDGCSDVASSNDTLD